MKAIQFFSYGGSEVLKVTEVARPEPGEGQVLVAVRASSVNGHDVLVRFGAMKMVSGRRFPIGSGLDFAGVVAATGPGVTGVRIGQAVWGMVHPREKHEVAAAAEYVVVPAERVAAMPAGLSAVEAAALLVPGATALTALRRSTRMRPGERVLVRGAGGGVGAAAVQLAQAFGGEITALARTEQSEALTDLGADHVLDYRSTSAEEIGPFDVIVDTVGTELGRFRRRLTRSGRMVTVALSGRAIAAIAASTVYGSRRIRTFSANPTADQLDELAVLVASGALRPVVNAVYPLTDITAAHRAFEHGGVLGRQVVTMTGAPAESADGRHSSND